MASLNLVINHRSHTNEYDNGRNKKPEFGMFDEFELSFHNLNDLKDLND